MGLSRFESLDTVAPTNSKLESTVFGSNLKSVIYLKSLRQHKLGSNHLNRAFDSSSCSVDPRWIGCSNLILGQRLVIGWITSSWCNEFWRWTRIRQDQIWTKVNILFHVGATVRVPYYIFVTTWPVYMRVLDLLDQPTGLLHAVWDDELCWLMSIRRPCKTLAWKLDVEGRQYYNKR